MSGRCCTPRIPGPKGPPGPPGLVDCSILRVVQYLAFNDYVLISREIEEECELIKINIFDFNKFFEGGGCVDAWIKDPENSTFFVDLNPPFQANIWGWSNGPYLIGDQVQAELRMSSGGDLRDPGFLIGQVDIDIIDINTAHIIINVNENFCICDKIETYVGFPPTYVAPGSGATVDHNVFPCKDFIVEENCDFIEFDCDIVQPVIIDTIHIILHTTISPVTNS